MNNYGRKIKKPKILWHYTSLFGAEGILGEDNRVRTMATDYEDLNDYAEFQLGCKLALMWLARSKYNDVVDEVKKLIDKNDIRVSSWIASFTEEDDSIAFWKLYTGKEGGVSIGYSFDMLDKAIKKYDYDGRKKAGTRLSEVGGDFLGKCVYVPNDGKVTPELSKMLKYVFSENEKFFHLKSENPEEYVVACTRHIVRVAALVKNNSFHYENEWRAVQIPYNDALLKRVRYVGGKNRLSFGKSIGHSVVKEVVVSPHGNVGYITNEAERIKRDFGYEFAISQSKSTYKRRVI